VSATTDIFTALNYLVADPVVEFGDCSVVLLISPTVGITQPSFGRLWHSIKQAVKSVTFMSQCSLVFLVATFYIFKSFVNCWGKLSRLGSRRLGTT